MAYNNKRGKNQYEFPPKCLTAEKLIGHYHGEGMTQVEIARKYGIGEMTVWRCMRLWGIIRRKAIPRKPRRGAANPQWKGDDASYSAFHYRIQKLKGKPKRCEQCRTTDPKLSYDWANLTGRYEDPNDYKRMCRSCHIKFDRGRAKKKHATNAHN